MFSWLTNDSAAENTKSAHSVEPPCQRRRSSAMPTMTGAPVRTKDGVTPFDYVKRKDGVIVWYPRGMQIDEAELNSFVEENRAGASHEEITDENREFFKQTKDAETHMIYFPRKDKEAVPAPPPAPVMAAPPPAPQAVASTVTHRSAAPQLYAVEQTQPQYFVVPDSVQYYLPVTSLQVQTSAQYYFVPQSVQYYAVAPTTTQEFIVQPTQHVEYVAGALPSVVYGVVPSGAVCYVK